MLRKADIKATRSDYDVCSAKAITRRVIVKAAFREWLASAPVNISTAAQ